MNARVPAPPPGFVLPELPQSPAAPMPQAAGQGAIPPPPAGFVMEAPAPSTAPDTYSETYFAQGTSGLNEGLANILGAPVDLANAAVGVGMKGINAVFGTDFQPSDEPLGGSAGLKRSLQDVGAIRPPTDETGKQVLRRTMQSVGSSAIPGLAAAGGAAQPVAMVGNALLSGGAGGAAAAASQQLFPDNPTAEMIAEIVASSGTAAATNWLKQAQANKAARSAIPSTQGLKEQAGKLYDQAEAQGITASQQQTAALRDDMRAVLEGEGLITPTGRVASSFPKVTDALNSFEDYSKGTMTVKQMKATRRLLSAAAQSADGAESRIGSMLLKRFDSFTDPLAPHLRAANQIYHRAMKAETLDMLDDLAVSRTGQFTGSSYENALRTEYRGLERNIIKGNESGWLPSEKQAISRVAQGTPRSNMARNIGRMSPTGPMSFAATAGVPFMIGSALGGPGVGGAAAVGASGLGYGARALATKMGINAANETGQIVRNGGQIAKGMDADAFRRLIAMLTAPIATQAKGN